MFIKRNAMVGAIAALSLAILPATGTQAGAQKPDIRDDNRPAVIKAAGKRFNTRRYHALIARHARANGVPLALAHAIVEIESRYNARARGRSGEVGLMQILPRTARGIGYRGSIKALYNPDTNLRWGMKYLGEARRRGDGSVCGTVLKYNAGHHAKRMNKRTAAYCAKVKRILGRKGGGSV